MMLLCDLPDLKWNFDCQKKASDDVLFIRFRFIAFGHFLLSATCVSLQKLVTSRSTCQRCCVKYIFLKFPKYPV